MRFLLFTWFMKNNFEGVEKMYNVILIMIKILFSTSYQKFYVSLWYNYNIKHIQLVLPCVILL